jgi:hypothetical protein
MPASRSTGGAGKPPTAPAEHPLVKALRAKTDRPTATLTGFIGDSGQTGTQRLYLSPQLDHYAEFADDDVLSYDDAPAETLGVTHDTPATRVTLRHGASVQFTRVRTASVKADNQFDLDVQLAGQGGAGPVPGAATNNCARTTACVTGVRTMCLPEPVTVACATAACNPRVESARTMFTWFCTSFC